jgi:hypothetical protein
MKKTLCAFLLILNSSVLFSQTPGDTTKISDLYLDFAIPDLGAFTLLGVSPQSAIRPGTPKELGTQILNAAGNGKLIQPGVAVDWSPLQTISSKYTTYANYMKSNKKLFRNLQMTFGTVADTGGTKLGYGLKWVLWDNSDPLRDNDFYKLLTDTTHFKHSSQVAELQGQFASDIANFLKAITEVYKNKVPDTAKQNKAFIKAVKSDKLMLEAFIFPTKKPAEDFVNKKKLLDSCETVIRNIETKYNCKDCALPLDPILRLRLENLVGDYSKIIERMIYHLETLSNHVDTLKKDYKKKHWNSFALQIGLGSVANSIDNTWDKLSNTSFKTYLSACGPFGKKRNTDFLRSAEWVLSSSYEQKYNTGDTDSSAKEAMGIAGRFLWAPNEFRVSLDCGLNFVKAKKNEYDKKYLRLTIGFEYKISDGNWIELAVGANEPVENWQKTSNIIALASFKHTINKEKRDLSRKR